LRLLLRFARSTLGSAIVRYFFSYFSFLIPFPKIYESNQLLVFHHPQPQYPTHLLFVPKRAIQGINSLTTQDSKFLLEVLAAAEMLAKQSNSRNTKHALIVNEGKYQEVAFLHFHLIATNSDDIEIG